MSFHDVRFPVGISRGASGGPERRTEIVTLASGYEERNSNWADSRRKYNAGYGVKAVDDLHTVIAFFEARHGRLYSFRWKDWGDYKSVAPNLTITDSDQNLGTGDGSQTQFQLVKIYSSGAENYSRTITKPVTGSVQIAVEDTPQTEGADFSADSATGIITLATPPNPGQAITAGYEFDVPVRFDSDFLDVNMSHFQAGQIANIPIVEVRL